MRRDSETSPLVRPSSPIPAPRGEASDRTLPAFGASRNNIHMRLFSGLTASRAERITVPMQSAMRPVRTPVSRCCCTQGADGRAFRAAGATTGPAPTRR